MLEPKPDLYDNLPTHKEKNEERALVAEQIETFLKNGGKIQKVPMSRWQKELKPYTNLISKN